MKHTPGPWIVYNDDDLAHSVLQAISRGDICRIGYYPGGIDATAEEINANARLIAASPDLFEACKAIFHATETVDSPDFISALAMVEKAIKKSEGRK